MAVDSLSSGFDIIVIRLKEKLILIFDRNITNRFKIVIQRSFALMTGMEMEEI